MKTLIGLLLIAILINCTRIEYIKDEKIIHDTIFVSTKDTDKIKLSISDTIITIINDTIRTTIIDTIYVSMNIPVLPNIPIDNTIKDASGNIYTSVKIGDQTWLTENLKTVNYNNGDPILTTTNIHDLVDGTNQKYQFTNPNGEYKVYTWYAINDSRGVCPSGYKIPSSLELGKLDQYVLSNGKSLASNNGWMESTVYNAIGNNQSINNSTGFNLMPIGYLYFDIQEMTGPLKFEYGGFGASTFLWCNNEYNYERGYSCALYWNKDRFILSNAPKNFALPIRCIKI